VTGGLLIGRVATGGLLPSAQESDVTMPANGRLYFGVNDDDVRDNVGDLWLRCFPAS
jgi:hypothetical protein